MKIKNGFILREMDDMNIVVAVGEQARSFNGVITLNSTAVFMWRKLSEGCAEEELIDAMVSEYNAPKDKITADVKAFVAKLSENGLLDE